MDEGILGAEEDVLDELVVAERRDVVVEEGVVLHEPWVDPARVHPLGLGRQLSQVDPLLGDFFRDCFHIPSVMVVALSDVDWQDGGNTRLLPLSEGWVDC